MRPPTDYDLVVELVPSAELPELNLKLIAHALTTQVRRDLLPAWGINAIVVTPDERSLFGQRRPVEVWPIYIVAQSGSDSHDIDQFGTPFAVVQYSVDPDVHWTVDLSHELVEMLVNPAQQHPGMRLIEGQFPPPGEGLVQFIVEVADPVNQQSYEIEGIAVSNFVYKSYYDLTAPAPYDKMGAVRHPLDVGNQWIEWLVSGNPPEHWYRYWTRAFPSRLINTKIPPWGSSGGVPSQLAVARLHHHHYRRPRQIAR